MLLDTHALLWWLTDDPHLSDTARATIRNPHNALFISSASAWEIATKHRVGKLEGMEELVRNLPELLRLERMGVLPVTLEHALLAGSLPGAHRDPFDRMLAAQSRIEGHPVVSRDRALSDLGAERIW